MITRPSQAASLTLHQNITLHVYNFGEQQAVKNRSYILVIFKGCECIKTVTFYADFFPISSTHTQLIFSPFMHMISTMIDSFDHPTIYLFSLQIV